MNGIILDACILIAAEKGRLDLDQWLASESPRATAGIAAITLSEMLHGAERADTAARAQERKAWIAKFATAIPILDFDEDCARVHATIWATLEKRGTPIGAHDLLVAATALHHDMTVATFNADEFKRVPNLDVITP